jgi:enamine deaminase RidA (YjgF/YER057c/UK114 family)
MPKKIIIKPAKSPAAVGPYNHAVRVGDLLFCAGQIPIDPPPAIWFPATSKFKPSACCKTSKRFWTTRN